MDCTGVVYKGLLFSSSRYSCGTFELVIVALSGVKYVK